MVKAYPQIGFRQWEVSYWLHGNACKITALLRVITAFSSLVPLLYIQVNVSIWQTVFLCPFFLPVLCYLLLYTILDTLMIVMGKHGH